MKSIQLVQSTSIDKKYYEKVAEYINRIANIEVSQTLGPTSQSLVGVNLKILEEIKDLSKVVFISAPAVTIDNVLVMSETRRYKLEHGEDHYDVHEMLAVGQDNVTTYVENRLAWKIGKDLNEKIEEGNTIYAYILCATVNAIVEKTMAPVVYGYSRYTYKHEKGQ